MSTSTAFFMPSIGDKFGEKLVWFDKWGDPCSVTLIVPTAFANLVGMGVAIDLTKDNFDIIKYDGRNIILEISEKDAKVLELVSPFKWGIANKSTLWVPAMKVLDANPYEEAFLNVRLDAVAGLLSRAKGSNLKPNVYGTVNICSRPSTQFKVLIHAENAIADAA
jgi:hypothetical protein